MGIFNRYHWVKLNDTTYISSFRERVRLAIVVQAPVYSYIITKDAHWDKVVYKKIVNQASN
jgi:hypothetical protein